MVWMINYQPKPNSWPDARHVGGDTDRMELEDATLDGGVNIVGARYASGRRLRTENAPTEVVWLSCRKLQDLESTRMGNVSVRLRELIEDIEPGVHQFIPIPFVSRRGEALGTRWFWQVCNRLDTVHRDRTNWQLSGPSWRPPKDSGSTLIFDVARIGRHSFWHDKYLINGPFISDEAKAQFCEAGMTGLRYHHYEQS